MTGEMYREVIAMAKQGMKRLKRQHAHPKNTQPPVPRIDQEKPVSDVYGPLDSDLGRDNLENDMTLADLQDF